MSSLKKNPGFPSPNKPGTPLGSPNKPIGARVASKSPSLTRSGTPTKPLSNIQRTASTSRSRSRSVDASKKPAPKEGGCAGCGKELTDAKVTALKQVWHPDCFKCGNCDKPIKEASFNSNGTKAFHINCKTADGTPLTCSGCMETISSTKFMHALGELWHPDCFKCEVCKEPITGTKFAVQNGKPIHADCRQTQATVRMCTCGCRTPIVGPTDCVTAFGAPWHRNCFQCGICAEPIDNEGACLLQGRKPFHKACMVSEDDQMMNMGNTVGRTRARPRAPIEEDAQDPAATVTAPPAAATITADTVCAPTRIAPTPLSPTPASNPTPNSACPPTMVDRPDYDDDFLNSTRSAGSWLMSSATVTRNPASLQHQIAAPCLPPPVGSAPQIGDSVQKESSIQSSGSAITGRSLSTLSGRSLSGLSRGGSSLRSMSVGSMGSLSAMSEGSLSALEAVEICSFCYLLIESEEAAVSAGDQAWHQRCLQCCKCGTELGQDSLFIRRRPGIICGNCH